MKEIKLTRGYVALVDDENFEYLNQWKWQVLVTKHSCYATRTDYSLTNRKGNKKGKVIMMHRQLLGIIDDLSFVGDHRDRNGLNNQMYNLRACTKSENNRNKMGFENVTSKYKGVCLYKGRWRAGMKHNKKQIHLGDYDTETEAALAYNRKASELQGEFANLNKI